MDEKLKGRAKEAVGALTGDEDKKAEGSGRAEEGRGCRGGRQEGQEEAGRGGG